jgi:diketogulonate reductase-like aldo/keto reductase
MGQMLALADEQYAYLKKIAAETGRTPEELLLAWAMEEEGRYRRTHPTYYETQAWMRHLGASDEEIARIEEEMQAEEAAKNAPDADA